MHLAFNVAKNKALKYTIPAFPKINFKEFNKHKDQLYGQICNTLINVLKGQPAQADGSISLDDETFQAHVKQSFLQAVTTHELPELQGKQEELIRGFESAYVRELNNFR